MFECIPVIDLAGLHDAACHLLAQLLRTPLPSGNADHGEIKGTPSGHRIECRKDHFVGKITRHAKDYQRIRRRCAAIRFVHPGAPFS